MAESELLVSRGNAPTSAKVLERDRSQLSFRAIRVPDEL